MLFRFIPLDPPDTPTDQKRDQTENEEYTYMYVVITYRPCARVNTPHTAEITIPTLCFFVTPMIFPFVANVSADLVGLPSPEIA